MSKKPIVKSCLECPFSYKLTEKVDGEDCWWCCVDIINPLMPTMSFGYVTEPLLCRMMVDINKKPELLEQVRIANGLVFGKNGRVEHNVQ